MSPVVRVHTHTTTRLQALSFHAQRFLELAGVRRSRASVMSEAIEKRWLRAVGVYGEDAAGERVVEQEFRIDWGRHESIAREAPVIDVSQPGWEENLAVEVSAACGRFRRTVEILGLTTSFWVIFVDSILNDPAQHEAKCIELGLSYKGKVPKWKGAYSEVPDSVSGLAEATLVMRASDAL